MLITVFRLSKERRLIIPTRTLISIIDNEDGNGSTIVYYEDTNEYIVRHAQSDYPALDVMTQTYELKP